MERKIKSLSWSKIYSFENFRSQFIKQYFAGEPFYETKEIIFGKVIGAILETQSFHIDDIIKVISTDRKGNIENLPQSKINTIANTLNRINQNDKFCEILMKFQFDLYPNYEVYLKEFIDNGKESICCTGYLDNSPEELIEFGEFKTGKTPWIQERAEDWGQIYFYAMMIEKKTGKLPKEAKLHWIVTENDTDGYIVPTGEIKTFIVKINPNKLKKLKERIFKIYDEMQVEYEKWLNSEEGKINITDDIFLEYAELEKQKKAIENKQKDLKVLIDQEFKSNNTDNYKIEGVGSFYYMGRKSWYYSEEILKKESKLKEEKKKFEESNEPVVNYYLTCKIS